MCRDGIIKFTATYGGKVAPKEARERATVLPVCVKKVGRFVRAAYAQIDPVQNFQLT